MTRFPRCRSLTRISAAAPQQFVVLACLLLISAAALSLDSSHHKVFPAARFEHYTLTDNTQRLLLRILDKDTFDIEYQGQSNFLNKAKQRFLGGECNLFVVPDDVSVYKQQQDNVTMEPLTRLIVSVASLDSQLTPTIDESYSIQIGEIGPAILKARTVFGALHGLETFSQLVNYAFIDKSQQHLFKIENIPIEIKDKPRYSHRGLMIDSARHYLPLELILDTLKAMAMNKLNVLHWHMTDEQSFPYVSQTFANLSEYGSFAPHQVYYPNDVQKVIHEAALRGIRVIPEFDMPGHTSSFGKALPHIMSHCPDVSSPLNPTLDQTFEVANQLYHEIVDVFPDSMIHIGGDEVQLDCWKNDASIAHWMNARNMTTHLLFEYFEDRLISNISSFRELIAWQEVFNDLPQVSKKHDLIVDVWKGYDIPTIQNATKAGLRVLISGCWYLDHVDKDWWYFYQCNPTQFKGSLRQKKLVIGGHASMWGEHVDASNFVMRVWPRASATAERLWSNINAPSELVQERLAQFRCKMLERNIMASALIPGTCPVQPKYNPHERVAVNMEES